VKISKHKSTAELVAKEILKSPGAKDGGEKYLL
jgi:hypothetical protein